MKKRILAALFALVLICAAVGPASAAQSGIRLGGKLGFMYEDMSVELNPKLYNLTEDMLKWESSDTSVAIADGNEIRSVQPGRTVITVSGGGASAQCGVVVLPKTVNLRVGERVSLPNGTKESYTMQYHSIAHISDEGVITGLSIGSTLLRVRYGSQTLYVQVNVTDMDPEALQSEAAQLDCASTANQIVLVDHESGSKATLSIHEKRSAVWVELYRCAAVLGRTGIGKEREGDGKTPVGTFNLTTPFGIKDDPGANSDYTKVTKYHYWCGTSGSDYYNQLVDMRKVDRRCIASDEYLLDYKGVYNYCMFVDYNAEGKAGRGSCIFLHCTGSKNYTAGCIAVPEKVMKKIIQWAEPGAKIVIR